MRFDVAAFVGQPRKSTIGGVFVFDTVPARAGVLHYPELGRRELYIPANDPKVSTLEGAPLVVGMHPQSGVLEAYARPHAPGKFTRPRVQGDELRADMHINDTPEGRAAVDEIAAGALRELSVGYKTQVEERPGTFRGDRYDAVQLVREVDHVALLPRGHGRCGAQCSVRGDQQQVMSMHIDHDPRNTKCAGGLTCTCGAPRADEDPGLRRFISWGASRAPHVDGRMSFSAVLEAMTRAELEK